MVKKRRTFEGCELTRPFPRAIDQLSYERFSFEREEAAMKRFTIPRVAHCSEGCPMKS